MNLKIVRTNDGSDTIYNKALDESYHSLHGSIKESEHVYINAGLDRVVNNKKNKFQNPHTFLNIYFYILSRVLHKNLLLERFFSYYITF